ncbi:MAG: hypothetical protein SAMD01599839_12660 [Rectinema sp.]
MTEACSFSTLPESTQNIFYIRKPVKKIKTETVRKSTKIRLRSEVLDSFEAPISIFASY